MATFKYYDGTKYNRITGGLVPKTTKTTSDVETYSCNYVNNEVDKLLPENSKTTGTTNTYSCDYINGIIESGSNENGNWIKFVDGTMICNCSITRNIANNILWNNMYIGDIQNIPFPQQFIELYTCNVDLYSTRNVWKMSGGIPTVSGTASMYSVSPESFTEDMRIFVIAIGRWK